VRLKNTGEYIHSSVRVRIEEGGLSTEEDLTDFDKVVAEARRALDKVAVLKKVMGAQNGGAAPYKSAALANYELVDGPRGVIWREKDGLEPLLEDALGATELRLLQRSVETVQAAQGGRNE